jgi:two-component system, sensor histidine kinase PdtaS
MQTPPVRALDLAMAVISSSEAPLLLLDGDLRIISASRSYCQSFGLNISTIAGQRLADLGAGEWDIPQLDGLLRATALGFAAVAGYEMSLQRHDRPARRLVVNAHKLDYPDGGDIRLLLSILDVTEMRKSERQKNELLREKAIL